MGKVYLIGAGPGDPELLTVKALRILERAQVVVHDRLVSREILRLAPHATLIDGGKRRGEQAQIQDYINQTLIRHARLCHTVVRLKAGDPMVFGRGAEEWEFLLAHGIDVEVVPGVSSALAVPALCGIPLTCRGIAASFAVIAGHREQFMRTEWPQYAHIDTLVVLMGVENREYIAESLIRTGRSPLQSVAFIENGTTERERVVETNLSAVAAGLVEVQPPAVLVIGEVVRLRSILAPARTIGAEAL
ncbi:MAG TPA: uroporphyrinogen-III C-methyltransferase [Bryobacteraceae bacterium]|nr:uroporphyrinogen-III C-methyltransferase [Bryobacteraceae bacterium]